MSEQPVQETVVEQESEKTVDYKIPELKYGYVVGIKSDEKFHFAPIGEQISLVNLLGIHQYAKHRVDYALEATQGHGFPVLAQQNHQIGEMIQALGRMLQQLQVAIENKKNESRIITP